MSNLLSAASKKRVCIFLAILFCICLLAVIFTDKADIGSFSFSPSNQVPSDSPSNKRFSSAAVSESATLSVEYNKGSCVEFGRYPQNSINNPEPIEWLVLDNDGHTALLVSKYGLDCKPFHKEYKGVSWYSCDLRKWLNSVFLETAFNDIEKQHIAYNTILTEDNPAWGTKGCGPSRDKLFCLSIDEVNKFFPLQDSRKCLVTSYAISHNAWNDDAGFCWFWLRSPGRSEDRAASVDFKGAIYNCGDVDSSDFVVRPALRIIL